MAKNPSHRAESKTRNPTIESIWTRGQRTQAWQTLWRDVLADVLPKLGNPVRADRWSTGWGAALPMDDSVGTDCPIRRGGAGCEIAAGEEEWHAGE